MIVIVLSSNSDVKPLGFFAGGNTLQKFLYDPQMSPPLAVMVLELSREGLNLAAVEFPHYTPKPTKDV